jgi:hypothetical protein
MIADDVMTIISENLTTRKAFKLWRMLRSRIGLIPDDVLQVMKEKEPELFARERVDSKGNIRFRWQTERY